MKNLNPIYSFVSESIAQTAGSFVGKTRNAAVSAGKTAQRAWNSPLGQRARQGAANTAKRVAGAAPGVARGAASLGGKIALGTLGAVAMAPVAAYGAVRGGIGLASKGMDVVNKGANAVSTLANAAVSPIRAFQGN